MITYYRSIFDASGVYVSEKQAINGIRGEKFADIVQNLRKLNKDDYNAQKKTLPALVWAGQFKGRKESDIEKYNGLGVLDFDHVENVSSLLEDLTQSEYCRIAFVSPSGHGVKMIIQFPADYSKHRDYYAAALEHFSEFKPDKATSDPCRLCFVSHDPNIYYNPAAKVFDKTIQKQEVKTLEVVSDESEKFTKLVKWVQTKEQWAEGQRNSYLRSLSYACCRFGIPETTALNYFINTHPADREYTDKKIANYFKTAYTKYAAEYNTVAFEKGKKDFIGILVSDNSQIGDAVFQDVLFKDNTTLNDVRNKIIDTFTNGTSTGLDINCEPLKKHFKLGRGRLVLFGGIPAHGKSQFVKFLMVLAAIDYGIKWQVFGPEDYPADDFFMDLCQLYIGINIVPEYGKQCSLEQLNEAMDFINEYFIYVYPENDSPTPEYILSKFEENIMKLGITGCLIDPFNQMDNDLRATGGREDLYVSKFCSMYKRFGQKHDIYTWVIAHPNTEVKPSKGEFDPPAPNQFNFSGGQIWNAKVDDILIIHRPFRESSPSNSAVEIYVKKVKKSPRFGEIGRVDLTYHVKSGRYLYRVGTQTFDSIDLAFTRKFSNPLMGFNGEDINF